MCVKAAGNTLEGAENNPSDLRQENAKGSSIAQIAKPFIDVTDPTVGLIFLISSHGGSFAV